jgi:predicted TIM-barrel fold metal-dependent hydrolase
MIIDCDTHILPKDAFDYVDPSLDSRKPHIKVDRLGNVVGIDFPNNPAYIPGTTPMSAADPTVGLKYRGNADIEARLADFERMGIDAQLVLPQLTGWWSYLLDAELGTAVGHSWNLSQLQLIRRYPDRLLGVALVALQDVPGAIRELDWATAEGFRAVMLDYVFPVAEHPYGTTLASHRELWAFFKRVEELDIPIVLHAVQHGHRVLNAPRFLEHGLDVCAPSDAELNLITLITSGLLDDFPALKIVHAETGTADIKKLAERLDARFEHIPIRFDEEGFTAVSRRKTNPSFKELMRVPPTVVREENKLTPSHYFRKNFFWTIETEEPELIEAIDFLGAEHFLFATDYPHDDPGGRMKFKDVGSLQGNKRISESDKEAIRNGNARHLFKLS